MKAANLIVDMWITCMWYGLTGEAANGAVEGNICNGRCCNNSVLVRDLCIDCPEGKVGENCNTNCHAQYYGKFCKRRCNCTEGFFCSSVYGCVPQNVAKECPPGKHGEDCVENCPPNKYGPNCTTSCRCNAFSYCHPEKGCREIPFSKTNDPGETQRDTKLFIFIAIIIVVGIVTGLFYIRKYMKTRTFSPVTTSNNNNPTRNVYFENEHSTVNIDYPSLVTPGPSSACRYPTPAKTHDRDTRLSDHPYDTTSRSNNETTGHSERENYYYTVSPNLAENWQWYAKSSRHCQHRSVYRESGVYTSLSFDNILNFSDDEDCNRALKTVNETM